MAATREREEHYRLLYDHTPVMMHSVDGEGRVISVNDHWLENMGYERGEVIGRRSTEFLTETSRRYAIDVELPKFFERGFAKDIQYQMVRKNRDVRDVLLSASSHRDDAGNISESLAFIDDVTERKRAEQALRESERRFRGLSSLVDQAAEAFFVIGPGGRFVDVNRTACVSLGYTREELLNLSVPDVEMEFDAHRADEAMKQMARGEPVTLTGTHRRKDGTTFPVEVSTGLVDWGGRDCFLALV